MGRKYYRCSVKLWDKKLRRNYYKVLSAVSVFFTLLSIKPVEECLEKYMNDDDKAWKAMLILYIVFLAVTYMILWIHANRKKTVRLNINGNTMEIRQGNIFEEPDDVWKVINTNEYFDTELGGTNSPVSSESVQGQYLMRFYPEGVTELDERISKELSHIQGRRKKQRKCGKDMKYPLGTVFCDRKNNHRYLLTAFAKMDDANRAYLSTKDYVNFLMNFWEEIDKIYNGHSVTVSLFGTGIVRLDDPNITHQKLLELIIWSFRNSRMKLAYGAKVTILLYGKAADEVRLYGLE